MPAKQRAGSKPKAKVASSSTRGERQDDGPVESERSNTEAGGGQQRVKKKGVSWTPVFKRIGFFLLLFLIPGLLNYAVLNQEARMLIPEGGTLYDIGWNQKMFLKCTGQGLPTVILDAPVGQSSDLWVMVEPLIAKWTKVCVYDRAGLGFSDRAYQNTSEYANDFSEAAFDRDRTMPSTVERMADDLHRLITYSSNQPKPVLLVSLDFTTFVSRFYAQIYEHEVAGMLLIDPAFEMLFDSEDPTEVNPDSVPPLTWSEYWYKRMVPHAHGMWLNGVVGFNRLSLMIGLMSPVEEKELVNVLPKDMQTRKKHLMCQPKHLYSAFNEYFHMNDSVQQMKTVFTVKPFPQIPITMATYKETIAPNSFEPELAKVWQAGQEQLKTSVHPESKHIVLPGHDYLSLYTHPSGVANAVIAMVEEWRRESKLSS